MPINEETHGGKKGDETMEASRDVVLYKMPESRPCDYCFSLLDGSVFVDFEIKDALSYLVRISFDGYGCYCIQGESNPLCRKNTELLEKIVRGGIKDSDKGSLLALIKNAIKINRPLLRADEPLKEYALIGENDFILCRDKFDVESIENIAEREIRENPERYAGLLECFQDMNWPVAAVAQKKLIFDDEEIVPYLKAALSSGDEDWGYFLRKQIIPKMSEKIKTMLQMEIPQ